MIEDTLNPFASGIKKVLLSPITGLFSVKNQKKFLAIKNFSVNDTMSEAPADYQPAPCRTDGVPERHQRQWIINPSLKICAWNFNRTGCG